MNELFPIYAANSDYILGMNGYGVDLLGIANFRACLLACPMIEDELQCWVPRRLRTNMRYLGLLGSSVGASLAFWEAG